MTGVGKKADAIGTGLNERASRNAPAFLNQIEQRLGRQILKHGARRRASLALIHLVHGTAVGTEYGDHALTHGDRVGSGLEPVERGF